MIDITGLLEQNKGKAAAQTPPPQTEERKEEAKPAETGGLLDQAAQRAKNYLDGIRQRAVAADPKAVAALENFWQPLQDDPLGAGEVLEILDDVGSPATVASAGGRYFGFVVGGALPAAVAANWLAAAWDQNAGLWATSPVAATLEEVAIGWVVEALGLPASSGGTLVTGTTLANLTCLAAARNSILKEAGWDVEAMGLFGAPPVTVIASEQAHASLWKAVRILGLGSERVIRVPVDAQGRMRADRIPHIKRPAIVCLQAGHVDTGNFDPAGEIIAKVKEAGAWVHVDGAFGLWAAVSPSKHYLTAGFEEADSWATDAHKWPNVTYDCGLALVRNAEALRAAMSVQAPYLSFTGPREPLHYAPEVSRRARGVELWAALKSLGRRGLTNLVERTCAHAVRFAEGLRSAGYEVLNDVVLNQVLVSFGSDTLTRRVIAALQDEGTCWCGGTRWRGRAAMRISVASWATTVQDIERSLEAILRVAAQCREAN
jgi:glutamate/tyrosine decarboxylase-like PLP-dependent enzyme